MNKEIKKALDEIDELKKYLKRGERLIQPQIDRDGIRRYLKRTERSLESALNQVEENEETLKIIFGEILNNSQFQVKVIEDSDACIIIKEYCLGNLLRDFKITFNRRYLSLIKKAVEKYGR